MTRTPTLSRSARRAGPRAAAVVAALVAATATTTVGAAAAEDRLCTRGDATSVLQAGIVGSEKRFDTVHPGRGIYRSNAECQAQVTNDGATYTFSENEVFALQTTGFVPWRCFYDSARESVADFELQEERIYIAPVLDDGSLGEETELALSVTPVKTVVFRSDLRPLFGDLPCLDRTAVQLHYRTVGAIVDLAPGEYQVRWTLSYAGELYSTTITVVILEA